MLNFAISMFYFLSVSFVTFCQTIVQQYESAFPSERKYPWSVNILIVISYNQSHRKRKDKDSKGFDIGRQELPSSRMGGTLNTLAYLCLISRRGLDHKSV